MPTLLQNCRWTDANTAEFISETEIHVWKITLFDPGPDEVNILSENEIKRSDGFKNKMARTTYLCSRLVMRMLFSSYLKQPAVELKFNTTPQGKPFLDGGSTNLKFNLSHSGNLVLLAVSPSIELGIDLEKHRTLPDWEKIAHKVFDANWIQQLKQHQHPEKAFISRWTEFEARQKLQGAGIFGQRTGSAKPVSTTRLKIDGHAASLCHFSQSPQPVLSCYEFHR